MNSEGIEMKKTAKNEDFFLEEIFEENLLFYRSYRSIVHIVVYVYTKIHWMF